jgi:hypothetical protein
VPSGACRLKACDTEVENQVENLRYEGVSTLSERYAHKGKRDERQGEAAVHQATAV